MNTSKGFMLRVFACALGVCLMGPTARAICVKVNTANLRASPSTKSRKTWVVYRYMPLRKTGSRGGWFRVNDVDGDTHWISSNLTTQSFRCAVVKTNSANLRQGPGTRYRKVGNVEKYLSFRVLQIKGPWVRVKDELGAIAWIYRSLVWIN